MRVAVRDSVLSAPGSAVYVLRPAGGPEDTVAGFMVVSPRLRLAHWMGVKRTFRKLGLGVRLVEEAERLGVRAFARVGSWKHRAFLEGRGWTYSPRLEVIACS